jgi:DNA-directed RNA polymerase specialized sigma24 family protein
MQPTIDHEALEHEVSRLHVLAASLVGSDDAPDVVQDAWIAARTAAPKRALGPWLRGVVRNKARMQRRASVCTRGRGARATFSATRRG